MTRPTENPPPGEACERAGLFASLRADGAATAEQIRELDAHRAVCAGCRESAALGARVDAAVGERLPARADRPVPAGFAGAVVAAAVAQRTQMIAESRFLRRVAAAAVFVVAVAGGSLIVGRDVGPDTARSGAPRTGVGLASARDAARTMAFRPTSRTHLEGR